MICEQISNDQSRNPRDAIRPIAFQRLRPRGGMKFIEGTGIGEQGTGNRNGRCRPKNANVFNRMRGGSTSCCLFPPPSCPRYIPVYGGEMNRYNPLKSAHGSAVIDLYFYAHVQGKNTTRRCRGRIRGRTEIGWDTFRHSGRAPASTGRRFQRLPGTPDRLNERTKEPSRVLPSPRPENDFSGVLVLVGRF